MSRSGRVARQAGIGDLADDARGGAAVEFAMIGALLLALLLGLLDLTRLGFALHQLDQAASAAARFAAVRSADSDQPASLGAIESHARDLAFGLGGAPLDVTVQFLPDGRFAPGNRVQVELAYRFAFTSGLLSIPDLELSRRTTMPILN
jgi:hypothetical protein